MNSVEMTLEKPATMRRDIQVAPTPMHMIERALADDTKPEQMAQLFELQLRWEANEARKSFYAAMAKFKDNPPQINKNKHVKFGQTEYDHATLDHVVDQISPALSAVGIRHRWENSQTEAGWVAVTCILSHEMGHSESTTLKAQADNSGSKNGIQAIASTVTYLQRYTLLSATGMAAAGTDNDGAGNGPSMPEADFLSFRDNISDAPDQAERQKRFVAAHNAATKANDMKALKAFIDCNTKRKEELA